MNIKFHRVCFHWQEIEANFITPCVTCYIIISGSFVFIFSILKLRKVANFLPEKYYYIGSKWMEINIIFSRVCFHWQKIVTNFIIPTVTFHCFVFIFLFLSLIKLAYYAAERLYHTSSKPQ